MMPPSVAMRTYREHQAFYDELQQGRRRRRRGKPRRSIRMRRSRTSPSATALTAIAAKCKAAVILISGCQDNQTSMDGDHNGAFTEQLLKVWNHGGIEGNYAKFHAAIKARMPPTQTPNLFTLGPAAVFAQQQPFSV